MNAIRYGRACGAALFVGGAWIVSLALALGFVARYGSEVPVWDDFDLLGPITGVRPASLSWLWSQHNEHRVPLPRLVLFALDRLGGHDARQGMFFSVVILATAAAMLIAAARRWRDGSSASDALFPIILLGLGHYANLLWSWQVQFTIATSLFLAIVAIGISGRDERLGPGRAGVLGVLLSLLPLCGANGLAFVPALCAWLVLEAVRQGWQGDRRGALLTAMAVVPALLVVANYQRGYRTVGHHVAAASLGDVIRTLWQFAALSWGPVGGRAWNVSGSILMGLGLVAVLGLLTATATGSPQDSRLRCLVFGWAAFACLALGLAWGRAGSGDRAGLETRYVTLASPALCLLYLSLQALPRATPRELFSLSMFAAVCVLAWPNAEEGLMAGRERASRFAALVRDVRAGEPASLLARRYTPFLHPSQDVLIEWLPVLRRARIGPFAELRGEPPSREVALADDPVRLQSARRQGTEYDITGVDPEIAFRLPRAMFVRGIRLRYDHSNADGTPARFRLSWTKPGQGGDVGERSYSNWALPTGRERATTVWVYETIEEFQIQPDNRPCTFRIDSMVLIVP
jgi:hypothetical protein